MTGVLLKRGNWDLEKHIQGRWLKRQTDRRWLSISPERGRGRALSPQKEPTLSTLDLGPLASRTVRGQFPWGLVFAALSNEYTERVGLMTVVSTEISQHLIERNTGFPHSGPEGLLPLPRLWAGWVPIFSLCP